MLKCQPFFHPILQPYMRVQRSKGILLDDHGAAIMYSTLTKVCFCWTKQLERMVRKVYSNPRTNVVVTESDPEEFENAIWVIGFIEGCNGPWLVWAAKEPECWSELVGRPAQVICSGAHTFAL